MTLLILYIIGIVSEAMTGSLSAGKRKMDLFGVILIASITSLGGGTIRDILLNHYPLTWVKHPYFLILTCLSGICATQIPNWITKNNKLFLTLDAIGLITFTIIGFQIALEIGCSPLICIVSGLITGVFGGLMRDILTQNPPIVLYRELYASVSILTSGIYLFLINTKLNHDLVIIISFFSGLIIRLLAIKFNLNLPTFSIKEINGNSKFKDK